jgi:hypothetical protein
MIRTIYYYISKLNEPKALKLAYSDNKESVIFRDYIDNLMNVDIKEKIKLLEIINSKESKRTAMWLEEIFNFPEHLMSPIDYTRKMHPALKKILDNSIAYINSDRIYLMYKNIDIAELDAEELYTPSLMNFKDAIDWMIENADKIITKPNIEDFLTNKKLYENAKKYIDIQLSSLREEFIEFKDFSGSSNKNEIKLDISSAIELINYQKIAETIIKLPANEKTRISFTSDKELDILNKIADIIDISQIKNSQLRLLFKMIKATHKPLVALTAVHYICNDFEAACYKDLTEFKDHKEAFKIVEKIKMKQIIKKLKRVIKDGFKIENGGITIKYDGKIEVNDISKLKSRIKFPIIYY